MKPLQRTTAINETIKETYLASILPRLQEKRTRSFTTLVMTFLAIAIFGFFAINPTLATIAQLQKQIDDNTFIDQQLTQKISNMSTLQDRFGKLQNDLPFVTDAIPASPAIPLFVGQIQSVAEKSSVQLERIQTLPVEVSSNASPVNGYFAFGFDLNAVGLPDTINGFLSRIQSIDRLVTIDAFSITQTSATSDLVRIDVKGKAYYKKM